MRAPLALVFFAAVASATHAGAQSRPSSAKLRTAFENNASKIVEVVGPRASGAGIVVGDKGQVLTSVEFVALESAKVRAEGKELPAKVLLADADLHVAVVQVDGDAEWRAAAVRDGSPSVGDWLVGVERKKRGTLDPSAGRVTALADPFFDADLFLPPGSPLFDLKGQLVAISVRLSRTGCRALPVSAVKTQLSRQP